MRRNMTLEERQQMFEDRRRFRIVNKNKGRKLSKENLEKLVAGRKLSKERIDKLVEKTWAPPEDYLERRAAMEAKMAKYRKPIKQD